MQRDGGVAGGVDACEHGVEAGELGGVQQFLQQQPADAAALAVAAHVDRVLHAGAVGRALLVRRQRAEPDDLAGAAFHVDSGLRANVNVGVNVGVGVNGNDGREGAGSGREPLLLVGQTARHQVEGGGGVHHLVVVDGADLLGIGRGGESDRSGAHERRG